MKIKIRKARLADIPAIENLGKNTREFIVSRKIRFYETSELKDWIRRPAGNIFLVATDGNKIIGFLFSKIISVHWAMLDNMVVSPQYRKKGVGTLLLSEFTKLLEKKGISYIQGLVGKKYAAARKFWRNRGFEEGNTFVWIEKHL